MSAILILAGCTLGGTRSYPVWQDTSPPGDTSADTGSPTTSDTDTAAPTDTGTPGELGTVGVGFTGLVTSISGNPLGLDATVDETFVSGSFTYDQRVTDGNPDPELSEYDHTARTGRFDLFIGGKVLEGSGNPIVTIDVAREEFVFVDGRQLGDVVDRVLEVDEVEDVTLEVTLEASPGNSDTAFANDRLPDPFPFVDWDVYADVDATLTVEDSDGTLEVDLDDFLE